MLAILSPAKTLDLSDVDIDIKTSEPKFIEEAKVIM